MSRRAADEGSLGYDSVRDLWVGRLPRSVDPKRRAVYAKTQREAREKLRRAIRDSERGLVSVTSDSRLGSYLDHWLTVTAARVRSSNLAPSTAVGYERDVRLHIRPALGRIPLRQLSPTSVESFMGRLLAEGYAPRTVRHIRATLSASLTDAMRDQLVVRNVARLVAPPRIERAAPSAFTPDEFRRIVGQCQADRLGALFVFVALTGLRRSEALGLVWSDVDLDAGTFRVSRGLHAVSQSSERVVGEKGLITSRPKTEASATWLPLSKRAAALLRGHRTWQAGKRLASVVAWPDDPDDTHVFASSVGTAMHPSNVSRRWHELLARAEVATETPDGRKRGMHELRRTFATRLRDAGVPLEDVQRLGRWSSSKMLLEVYAASDDGRLRRAAEKAAEALE